MDFKGSTRFFMDTVHALMSVDSPTGFTSAGVSKAEELVQALGYPTHRTNKGNLVITVEGRESGHAVGLCAHLDTLGLVVRSITDDGQLMFTSLGAPQLPSLEGEYCRI